MFSYRKILRQALDITWKNKYLWFFGLFATLIGTGGEYQLLNNISEGNGEKTFFNLSSSPWLDIATWNNIVTYFSSNYWQALFSVIVLIIIAALAIFIIILSVTSQGALVHQTEKIANKKTKDSNLSAGTLAGQKHFWPVLGVNIGLKIVISLMFALMALPIILSGGLIGSVAAYVVLFLLFIPVIISFSLVARYAIGFIVIKKNKFSEALDNGWELFRKNWVVSIEMAILLILINILFALGVLIIIFLVSAPFLILSFIFSSFAIFWLFAFLGLAVLFLSIIAFGAMITTFQISAWTLLFLSLLENKGKSKIKRLKDKEKAGKRKK
ncbi:MAG: hypothetical protein K9M44_04005 [Candidatus Pacebacteria bacterium]|nr:hypothetical protein [Candidatus Paceibacterota bacterium]